MHKHPHPLPPHLVIILCLKLFILVSDALSISCRNLRQKLVNNQFSKKLGSFFNMMQNWPDNNVFFFNPINLSNITNTICWTPDTRDGDQTFLVKMVLQLHTSGQTATGVFVVFSHLLIFFPSSYISPSSDSSHGSTNLLIVTSALEVVR